MKMFALANKQAGPYKLGSLIDSRARVKHATNFTVEAIHQVLVEEAVQGTGV